MHALSAVAKDSHVSLPAILSEDARKLDLFDPITNAPSASSSTEECPQLVNDEGMSVQHGQIWLAYLLFD